VPSAQQYINDAIIELGVYAPGETMSDADSEQCLRRLNQMLDTWSTESLTVFALTEQTGALVANKNSYTIGTGGDFNLTRPDRVKYGPGAAYCMMPGNNQRFMVDVIPQDQWNLIGNLLDVTSNIVLQMFYDPQFPLGKINVYPTPNTNINLFWDSDLPFTQFANLATNVTFPPGYDLAITLNLALQIKSIFTQAPIDPLLVKRAGEAKAAVKRLNYRQNVALFDPAIVASPKKTWDWRQGSY
jgi:hypothetical protein